MLLTTPRRTTLQCLYSKGQRRTDSIKQTDDTRQRRHLNTESKYEYDRSQTKTIKDRPTV